MPVTSLPQVTKGCSDSPCRRCPIPILDSSPLQTHLRPTVSSSHCRVRKFSKRPTHVSADVSELKTPHQDGVDRGTRDDTEMPRFWNGFRESPVRNGDAHAALDDAL